MEIANRGHVFRVTGPRRLAEEAQLLIEALYAEAADVTFDSHGIHLRLNQANVDQVVERAYEAQK